MTYSLKVHSWTWPQWQPIDLNWLVLYCNTRFERMYMSFFFFPLFLFLSAYLRRSESHFTAADPRQSQVRKYQAKSHSSVENSTSMRFYDQIIAQLGVLRKLLALHTHMAAAPGGRTGRFQFTGNLFGTTTRCIWDWCVSRRVCNECIEGEWAEKERTSVSKQATHYSLHNFTVDLIFIAVRKTPGCN